MKQYNKKKGTPETFNRRSKEEAISENTTERSQHRIRTEIKAPRRDAAAAAARLPTLNEFVRTDDEEQIEATADDRRSDEK